MAEEVCLRSLWQTLTAAASTYVLFVAANWDLSDIDTTYKLAKQILLHTVFAFGAPLFPFFNGIINALRVRRVKRWLAADDAGIRMDHGAIAIITLCRIFIQIPACTRTAVGIPEWLQSCSTVTKSLEDEACRLELQPAGTSSSGAAHTDATGSLDVAQNSTIWVCLKLPSEEIGLRARFLSSGLAPKYKQLKFIRARNRFQTVITLLQAGGYVLSVVQRLLQRLGISPVEAITSFLSILVALQLLIELYACGNYNRPLLLRLNAQQLERFRDAPRIDDQVPANSEGLIILLISGLFIWLLMSIPSLYYFSHYVHTHLISAVSSFLFFLSQMLLAIASLIISVSDTADCVSFSLLVCSVPLYGCSLIVAVVGTIVDWSAFHNPSIHNWFAWILPHVSS